VRGIARRNLAREAAITILFAYVLLLGGTLNGLVLYEVINLSLGMLAVVGVAWLGWAWYRRQPIAFPPVTVAYAAYLVAYGVAAALSSDPRRSLNALCLTTLYALVWLLVSDLIRKGWPAGLFTRVMTAVGTVVIGLALWQTARYEMDWLALSGGDPLLPPVVVRPNPLLSHANMVAAFLNLLWPIVLVGVLTASSWPRRAVAALWVLLGWVVILLTSSRGGWLGAAVAFPVTTGLCWLAGRRGAGRKTLLPRSRLSVGRLAVGVIVLLLVAVAVAAAMPLLQNPTHASGFGSRRHFWETAWETFLARPIVGLGPDTYATAYTLHTSVPPNELYLHPHSKLMLLLAENGLLGVLGGGVLLVAVGWAGWRRWRGATAPQRRLLAGVAGGLVAAMVHSLFDTPTEVPVNALVIAVLTAILTSPWPQGKQRCAAWYRLAPTVLLLSLLAAGAWSQFAYRPYLRGTASGNAGDWEGAASYLGTAVARDPGHALYSLAAGYAYGVLADRGDADALPVAIRCYEAAIVREPGYGLNYANLAALYWQQGATGAALAAAERAVQAAPQEATFWLNLGSYHEKMGDLAKAREAYDQALTARPWWARAYYWRANGFRRSVLEAWQAAHPSQEPRTAAELAWAALTSAGYEEALSLYEEALAADPRWAFGYVGRAEAFMELGRYEEATRDARAAALLSGRGPIVAVRSDWILAQIAHRQGDLDTALALGEQVLDAFRWQSAFGPGTLGASIHGWGAAYYRVGLAADMLPQLETIRFTDREVGWLETVGGWYEEAGDPDAAHRLYQEALEAAPDAVVAAERLAALEGR